MEQTFQISQKVRRLLVILVPILITQVTMFAMSFFDTVMSGRYSANDLAGVAIGSSIWLPVQTGLSGILLAITPMVAQYLGAGRQKAVQPTIIQGIYLALVISAFIIIGGILFLDPLLQWMDLDEPVRWIARQYLLALAFGIPAFFIYTVLRCFIDALGQTRVTMNITLLSLPVNVVLNYIFIFGKLGLPALGGIGAGIASAMTYVIICTLSIYVVMKHEPFAGFRIFGYLQAVSLKLWLQILKIGLPIGFAIFFETSIFAAVTLLMSGFDTITIAAHQAAMNFSSLVYMVPLSISMSLTILIGYEVGARRWREAKQYGVLGIGIALVMASLFGVLLYVFNGQVAGLYTTEDEVRELARHFLIYAIFFLLSDAVGAPIQGVLRGYKDVNTTFMLALLSYWVIGLPSGYVLAKYTSLGAFGYWIGLIIGLAVGAVCLLWRLIYIQRKHQQLSGTTSVSE